MLIEGRQMVARGQGAGTVCKGIWRNVTGGLKRIMHPMGLKQCS